MMSRHTLTIAGLLLVAAFLYIGSGFLTFVGYVQAFPLRPVNQHLLETEAVVVLTGGSERLQEGLNILKAGKAKKLLVSGVHPSVKVGALLAQSDMPEELKNCCIVLGKAADNTAGNALETKAFMQKEEYKKLRLVTANYHMPRSLYLFGSIMPDYQIIPHAVSPDAVDLEGWWYHPGTAYLLLSEYAKYVYARIRLSL